MERSRELKKKWSSIILRIQHKTGAITFDENYLSVVNILIGGFIHKTPIKNSDALYVEQVIKGLEQYYKSL